MTKDSHILIVGAGGNIGSHLVPHIGRMPDVTRVTLVDSDRYEDRNLSSQDVTPRDIGQAKAAVQARRLRQINPALHVVAHRSAVEALPLGALRANVLLACVDSRASRQFLNESARRLGMPWIDAGVDAAGLLVRVNVYPAQEDAPCLECAWSDDDYAALEQRYPCAGNLGVATVATAAPSALGAVAAALQAIECQKLLDGSSILASGRQVLLDLAHHKQYVTSFRRNPACLLASHSAWPISRVAMSLDSPDGVTALAGLETASAFGIAGRQLASRQICTSCGEERRGLRFVSAHPFASEECSRCHAAMLVPGTDATESLSLPLSRHRRRSLASLGVRPRDVLIVRDNGGDSYFEIDGDGQ